MTNRSEWTLKIWDPTLIFAIFSTILGPLKSGNPAAVLQYFQEPSFLVGLVGTLAVVLYARGGKQQVKLEAWEMRAATWYLLNGFIFHYVIDFTVTMFGAVPVLREAFQQMDTRYGCLPQYMCEGKMGVTRAPDPVVFVIAHTEAFVHTPLCMLTFTAYLRGWHSRRSLELVTAVVQIVGAIIFQLPELYRGLRFVPPPPYNVGGPNGMFQNLVLSPSSNPAAFEAQVTYFWFAFVFANSVWYVVPARYAWTAFKGIVEAEAAVASSRKAKMV